VIVLNFFLSFLFFCKNYNISMNLNVTEREVGTLDWLKRKKGKNGTRTILLILDFVRFYH
jgi:hypothetical protein